MSHAIGCYLETLKTWAFTLDFYTEISVDLREGVISGKWHFLETLNFLL